MNGATVARPVLAVALALAVAACGSHPDGTVLTERVRSAPLTLSVRAEGELEATKATPLLVPGKQWTPRQLTWLAPDGSHVHKGDLVARFSAAKSKQDLAEALVDLERNAIDRAGKRAELDAQRGQLDVDLAQVASQLAIAHRYAHAGFLALSRNKVLDAVQDEHFLQTKRGILDWRRGQSTTRGEAELAVIAAKRSTLQLNADQKRADLDALELHAPHDGVLVLEADWSGEKPHVGTSLWAGNPLASLPDTASMQVRLAVPQVQAQGIRVGATVELHPLGVPEQAVRSKIAWVAAAAQTRSRKSPVKYVLMKVPVAAEAVRHHGWIPGQRFVARIVLLKADKAISVPSLAVDTRGDGATVKVREGGRTVRRAVELGVRGADRSQVLGGLRPGDRVVLDENDGEAGT